MGADVSISFGRLNYLRNSINFNGKQLSFPDVTSDLSSAILLSDGSWTLYESGSKPSARWVYDFFHAIYPDWGEELLFITDQKVVYDFLSLCSEAYLKYLKDGDCFYPLTTQDIIDEDDFYYKISNVDYFKNCHELFLQLPEDLNQSDIYLVVCYSS